VTSAAKYGWQVRVVDFGSASLTEPERLQSMGITNVGLTQTGDASSLTGTLLYLAPEILSGQAPTASADLYALGVMLYQTIVGDFRKPLSPGWEGEIEDPLLREDIALAACGDPRKRMGSAKELAARLRDLDRRRAERHRLALEAVDVESNRLLWRDTVNVPSGNLLALQAQIAATTRGKLAPALGASELVREMPANPENEQAYDLYLRSVPIPYDPEPNKKAIAMLEQSVELDRGYSPAWQALSLRYYHDGREAGVLAHSDQAAERALALDPDSLEAANELALHRAERGDLARAYREAQELVRRRPDSAVAHHLLSYVLRYVGVLDEAGRQCDMTTLLDPLVGGSCSATFMEAGNYKHAMDYVRKDFSSEWSKAHGVDICVREDTNKH
jgi:serine/threonine protein kinase